MSFMILSNVLFVEEVSQLENINGFIVPVVMLSVRIAKKEDQHVQLVMVTFGMVIADCLKLC